MSLNVRKINALFILLAFLAFDLPAQQEDYRFNAQKATLEYLGQSRPIKQLASSPLTDREKRKQAKRLKPRMVENFIGGRSMPKINPDALPMGADPARQLTIRRNHHPDVEPLVNTDGMDITDAGGVGVPDPNGAIGQNHYVQMVNATLFQVFNKNGIPVTGPMNVNTLWSEFDVMSGGDPIILYDREYQRWIITEFTFPGFGSNNLLIAVSDTDDPLGSYHAYRMTTPNFPDYPKYSIWNDVLLVTTNEASFFDSGLSFYAIDRDELLTQADAVSMQRLTVEGILTVPGFYTLSPVNWSGYAKPPADAPPMVMRIHDDAWGVVPTDRIEIFSIDTIDWENPQNSVVSGPVALETIPFDSDPCVEFSPGFGCVPQPGPNEIDAIPLVLMHQVHYRNFYSHESILLNFVVDATGSNVAGIRWMELRRASGGDWEIYQEGTFAPNDGLHRFIAGSAMDGAGNIGMAYSVSSESKHPSIRFTGRRAGDPPGEMTIEERELRSGTSSVPFDRYGDYASMQVDPYDDRTFWFTGEYVKTADGWGTGIAAFKLQVDTLDIRPGELVLPESGSELAESETVSFTIQNSGLDTVREFNAGYIFQNEDPVVESVSQPIAPGEVIEYSFQQPVDFGDLGTYQFTLFTSLDGDGNRLNDTIPAQVTKYPRYDIAIGSVASLSGDICGDSTALSVSLTNKGTEPALSVGLQQIVGGVVTDTFYFTRPIAFGQSRIASVPFTELADGEKIFQLRVVSVNGQMDEVSENDIGEQTITVNTAGSMITLELLTDRFPDETTWQLRDSSGTLILSGGNYEGLDTQLILENWCLNPGMCYLFSIFDSFGDGLTAQGVEGDYRIVNADGNVLASLMMPNFGSREDNSFCLPDQCNLTVEVQTSEESAPGAMDGAISIMQTGGTGGVVYSLDGGANFRQTPIFNGLSSGYYHLVARDSSGCFANVDSIFVDVSTPVTGPENERLFTIYPNPGSAWFKVEIKGVASGPTLTLETMDLHGRVVHRYILPRLDDSYQGEISLAHLADGIYFMRVRSPKINRLLRIVKKAE